MNFIHFIQVSNTDDECHGGAQPVMLTVVLPPEPQGGDAAQAATITAASAAGATAMVSMLPDVSTS
jgi:hypothetical protein